MTYQVVFSPEARDDLLELYDYIAVRSGEEQAIRYLSRIESWCESSIRFHGAAIGVTTFALAYASSVSSGG